MNLKFLITTMFFISTGSCSILNTEGQSEGIDSDELFASDRLSYRYENYILKDEGKKEKKKKPEQYHAKNITNNTNNLKAELKNEDDNFTNFKAWRKAQPNAKNYEDYIIWLEYQKYLNNK